MSITISTDVFCECGQWIHGTTGPKPFPKRARATARQAGWGTVKRGRRMVDLCPTCLEDERQGAD